MSGRCGTYGSYTRGCRCDDCRAAGTAYQRAYQRRRREERGLAKEPYDLPGIDEGDTSWMEHGACRNVGPDLFFPGRRSGRGTGAKAICAGCPVAEQCLDYALRTGQRYGIWGGMSYDERVKHRQTLQATKTCGDCGTDISGRTPQAVYCEPCVAEHIRESHRQANSRYYHSFKWEQKRAAS